MQPKGNTKRDNQENQRKNRNQAENEGKPEDRREAGRLWGSIGLLLCGMVFVMLGLWQKDLDRVFQKAVNICLECIGVG